MNRILRILALVAVLLQLATLSKAEDKANGTAEQTVVKLFLIGGSADNTLYDFAKLAGGSKAHIAIITYADNKSDEVADSMQNALSAANVRNSTIISATGKITSIPKDCDAVYMVGGHESRLMRQMKEPLLEELRNFKGLIGANSAGAMAAPDVMISGGMEKGTIKSHELHFADGIGLLHNVVIDSHVGQRNRDARCAATLGLRPDVKMVVGLDEDTAIYVEGKHATVYGIGHCRVFRPGPSFTTTLESSPTGTTGSAHNVLVSYLKAGESFDLP